jgi:hypothetical protein
MKLVILTPQGEIKRKDHRKMLKWCCNIENMYGDSNVRFCKSKRNAKCFIDNVFSVVVQPQYRGNDYG